MDAILRQGSKGNAVAELQQLLQAEGFYTGKVDGDFGTGTANAVLKFQKANGLTSDGIVGNASWKLLRSASQPPSSSTSLPTLLPGSQGQAVAQAQQLLKAKGYYQGRIDGDFGAGTRDSIANFQRANGLTVDGKVGSQTWQKLQAPAVSTVTPQQTPSTNPTEVVIVPQTTSSTPLTPAPVTTPTSSPTSSVFVPAPTSSTPETSTLATSSTASPTSPSVTPTNPSTSIPVGAISLISAANSYARAKLPNQTLAINNLQANIPAETLQQFFERWQTASGQVPSSLADAFSSYNAAQMTNQNLALQWLQNNLFPQAIDTFRQDWSRLNTSTEFGTPFTQPPSTPATTPVNNLQLISLSGAVKVYDRTKFPNQVTALENLQRSLSDVTLQQFFQRWAVASQQSTIPISLVDIFENYEDYNFPDQLTALQWLEKQLTVTQIEQFSRDWQA